MAQDEDRRPQDPLFKGIPRLSATTPVCSMMRTLDNLDKLTKHPRIGMNSPECDLKGHGPCSGPICQRGMTFNHRCDAHVRLEAYWTKRNPGKKLTDWLDGLQNAEREDALRKASPRGKHWLEVSEGSSEEQE